MSASEPAPVESASPPVPGGRYLDGAWHRLHPATPLLRGGIVLVAALVFFVREFWNRFLDAAIGAPDYGDDPVQALAESGLLLAVLGIGAAVLVLAVGLFWLTWRTSTFRIDRDAVTVRNGLLSRTARTARLDRIQGITVTRPLFARLLGAARIEFDVAGQNADVRLEYLAGPAAEQLRSDVLALAAGARAGEWDGTGRTGDDDTTGAPILRIGLGRALGSALLNESSVVVVALIGGAAVVSGVLHTPGPIVLSFFPLAIGTVTVLVRRTARTLRTTVTATSNGVRVASGLWSTTNETVPPGRVHAITVNQPLLWRPFGWWRVSVNRAGGPGRNRGSGEGERAIVPVASVREVLALLPHLAPSLGGEQALIGTALTGSGRGDGFVPAPRRARWLRPLAWRRTGFTLQHGVLVLRGGWLRRHASVVPIARIQSTAIRQGPADRVLGVADVEAHVVAGPVPTRAELVDLAAAIDLFDRLAVLGQQARRDDRSHRWAEYAALRPSVTPAVEATSPPVPPAPAQGGQR